MDKNDNIEASLDQNIIRKVLNNPILKAAVDNYCEPGVINLIGPEWKTKLENNFIYQKHKEGSVKYSTNLSNQNNAKSYLSKRNIINKEDCFEILVTGYFKVLTNSPPLNSPPTNSTPDSVIVSTYCKPIKEIGNVMCKQEFLQNCKFYMQSCGGICPSSREVDLPPDNMWSIKDTKVYTPKGIVNATRSYVQTVFQNPNIGIARISITMKYYFGNNSKIGGTVRSMIFIQENLLRSEETIKEILTLDTAHFVPNCLPECKESIPKKEIIEEEKNYCILAAPQRFAKKQKIAEDFEIKESSLIL
ncbi:hypothetical protein AVEN_15697-1 [Araneus ventricosus]|uniref:Uncharacterized protein n=1 Tax=Araneus ventricosus TaxID=182803 RepID=A0A4Y2JQR2_ARAVE|nr:hypothetical protein AVEN_15697-1 [Araneus ventricosus]